MRNCDENFIQGNKIRSSCNNLYIRFFPRISRNIRQKISYQENKSNLVIHKLKEYDCSAVLMIMDCNDETSQVSGSDIEIHVETNIALSVIKVQTSIVLIICVIPYSQSFLAGHKFGDFGPTRYNINFGGYYFCEPSYLH